MMNRQMELFARGGLNDEGGMIDGESGNEVPVGGTREGVRDDIDANVSKGEFIFPEDVTRYIGLDKLMQMRQKAKVGLQKMEDMGQMGNSDEAIIDDDMPFGMDDLIIVAGGEPDDGELDMAVGGLTTGTTDVMRTPDAVSQPFTSEVSTTGVRPLTPNIIRPPRTTINFKKLMGDASIEYKEYRNAAGNNILIPFIGGKAVFPIPEGYTLYTGDDAAGSGDTPTDDVVADSNTGTEEEKRNDNNDDRTNARVEPKPVDYDNISNEDLLKLAQDQTGTKGMLVKGVMSFFGPLGLFGMAAMSHQSKKILETINSRIATGIIGENLKGEFSEVIGLLGKGSGGLIGGAIDFVAGLLEKPIEEVEEVKTTVAEIDKEVEVNGDVFLNKLLNARGKNAGAASYYGEGASEVALRQADSYTPDARESSFSQQGYTPPLNARESSFNYPDRSIDSNSRTADTKGKQAVLTTPPVTQTIQPTQLPTTSFSDALTDEIKNTTTPSTTIDERLQTIKDSNTFRLKEGDTTKDGYIDSLLPPKLDLEATNKFFNNDMLPPRADQQPDVFPDQVVNFPTDVTNPAFAASDPRAGTYNPTDLQRNSQVFPTTASVGGGAASNYGEGYTAPLIGSGRGGGASEVARRQADSYVPDATQKVQGGFGVTPEIPLDTASTIAKSTTTGLGAKTTPTTTGLVAKTTPTGLAAKTIPTVQKYKAGQSNQATAWQNLPDANLDQAYELNEMYSKTGGTTVDSYAVGAVTDGSSQGVYANADGYALRDANNRVVFRNDAYDVPVVRTTIVEKIKGEGKYKPATNFDSSQASINSTNAELSVTSSRKNELSPTSKAKIGTDASDGDPNMAGAVWYNQPGTNVLTRKFPTASERAEKAREAEQKKETARKAKEETARKHRESKAKKEAETARKNEEAKAKKEAETARRNEEAKAKKEAETARRNEEAKAKKEKETRDKNAKIARDRAASDEKARKKAKDKKEKETRAKNAKIARDRAASNEKARAEKARAAKAKAEKAQAAREKAIRDAQAAAAAARRRSRDRKRNNPDTSNNSGGSAQNKSNISSVKSGTYKRSQGGF